MQMRSNIRADLLAHRLVKPEIEYLLKSLRAAVKIRLIVRSGGSFQRRSPSGRRPQPNSR